jgi:hypothetical protein
VQYLVLRHSVLLKILRAGGGNGDLLTPACCATPVAKHAGHGLRSVQNAPRVEVIPAPAFLKLTGSQWQEKLSQPFIRPLREPGFGA